MRILFVSSACSRNVYTKIFNLRNKKIIDPAQKFLEQIMRGTSGVTQDVKVISVSSLPISASTSDVKLFKSKEEKDGNVEYIYPGFINGKIMRYVTTFFGTFITISRVCKQHKEDTVIICDPLNFQTAYAARIAGKMHHIKAIAMITDIPLYATNMKQHNYSFIRKICQNAYEKKTMKDLYHYDGYINLTESMEDIVNPNHRSSIVIEGSVDVENIKEKEKTNKNNPRIMMYAGGIYEKYGVGRFVRAFINSNLKDVELQLYGDGEYVDELKKICNENSRVKYMGCILNTQLVAIESKADLLVNPRFSNESYTKYSFPSKTLEYMSSGTPVLSTRLQGIPNDYEKYLFWFDDESEAGMANKIKEIMELPKEELVYRGKKAQEFAYSQKSNVRQGEKIINLCKQMI